MWEPDEFNDLVTVARFNLPYQAHLLAGRLESDGIEAFVHDEANMSVTPYIAQIHGGIRVQVQQSDRIRAEEIIKSIQDIATPSQDVPTAIRINDEDLIYDLVNGNCMECDAATIYLRRSGSLATIAASAVVVAFQIPIKLGHNYFCSSCLHEWKG